MCAPHSGTPGQTGAASPQPPPENLTDILSHMPDTVVLEQRYGGRLVIVDDPPVKKRAANAAKENVSIGHVRHVTEGEQHIFRRVHEEDVGVDANIELCRRPEEPSGVVVGVQVKAGESYVRNETESTFTFYPKIEDLPYWRSN